MSSLFFSFLSSTTNRTAICPVLNCLKKKKRSNSQRRKLPDRHNVTSPPNKLRIFLNHSKLNSSSRATSFFLLARKVCRHCTCRDVCDWVLHISPADDRQSIRTSLFSSYTQGRAISHARTHDIIRIGDISKGCGDPIYFSSRPLCMSRRKLEIRDESGFSFFFHSFSFILHFPTSAAFPYFFVFYLPFQ